MSSGFLNQVAQLTSGWRTSFAGSVTYTDKDQIFLQLIKLRDLALSFGQEIHLENRFQWHFSECRLEEYGTFWSWWGREVHKSSKVPFGCGTPLSSEIIHVWWLQRELSQKWNKCKWMNWLDPRAGWHLQKLTLGCVALRLLDFWGMCYCSCCVSPFQQQCWI